MTFIKINNAKELKEAAQKLLATYPYKKLFAIRGPLGAGKTTFIKAICEKLGVVDKTASPTFSIINEYRGGNGEKIHHFDFYRIKNNEEAFDLGYEDYFYSNDYCFIEWPEKIAELVPATAVNVEISINGTERLITF